MQQQLRNTCRQLLDEKKVDVVIGYGRNAPSPLPGGDAEDVRVYPVFITRGEDVGQLVWNNRCHANLTVYLKRPEVRALGRPAIVVKGCDQRALVVLEKESQLDRSQIVVIGMACEGMGRAKCETCDVRQPRAVDISFVVPPLGGSVPPLGGSGGKPPKGGTTSNAFSAETRYADINAF